MNYAEMYVDGAFEKIQQDVKNTGTCILYSKLILDENISNEITEILDSKGYECAVLIEPDPDFIGSRTKLKITLK